MASKAAIMEELKFSDPLAFSLAFLKVVLAI